jgi:hypothetical protein
MVAAILMFYGRKILILRVVFKLCIECIFREKERVGYYNVSGVARLLYPLYLYDMKYANKSFLLRHY